MVDNRPYSNLGFADLHQVVKKLQLPQSTTVSKQHCTRSYKTIEAYGRLMQQKFEEHM